MLKTVVCQCKHSTGINKCDVHVYKRSRVLTTQLHRCMGNSRLVVIPFMFRNVALTSFNRGYYLYLEDGVRLSLCYYMNVLLRQLALCLLRVGICKQLTMHAPLQATDAVDSGVRSLRSQCSSHNCIDANVTPCVFVCAHALSNAANWEFSDHMWLYLT